jgi:hypothetical protein
MSGSNACSTPRYASRPVVAVVSALLVILVSLGFGVTGASAQNDTATVTDIANPDSYTCSHNGFVGFEGLSDGTALPGTIAGLDFVTTGGHTWLVGDFATGNYNGKYPNGQYMSEGTHWAWLGPNQGSGEIDMSNGPASYFSLLTSVGATPVYLEAYDSAGNLLAQAGPASYNLDTGHMTELTITRSSRDIAHVVVHDTGNFFLVDSFCTDAPGVTEPAAGPTSISLTPASATSQIGKPVTLTATVTDASGRPVPGVTVGFELKSGPDAQGGFTPAPGMTDASGQATLLLPGYTSGTDVVDAFFDISEGQAVTSTPSSVTFTTQPGDLSAVSHNVVVQTGKLLSYSTLATFTDADTPTAPASTFTARIDWGDPYFYSLGASVVSTNGGGYAVVPAVPHMFCFAGTHQFTATILEPGDGESITISGKVTVTAGKNLNDNCATGGVALAGGACTATVASWSGNTPVLITAAHCFDNILNPDGSVKQPQNYDFVPGGRAQTGAVAPFGDWYGTVAFVNSHYGISRDRYYDYAFIALNGGCTTKQVVGQCPKGPLPPSVGGLPIRWYPAQPQSGNLTAINAPWTDYAQLSSPSSCTAPPKTLTTDQQGSGLLWAIQPCGITDNGWPASGSPWIDSSNMVDSVLSSIGCLQEIASICLSPPAIRGTYLGPEAKSDFAAFTSSLP